jgi:hypothetical protein
MISMLVQKSSKPRRGHSSAFNRTKMFHVKHLAMLHLTDPAELGYYEHRATVSLWDGVNVALPLLEFMERILPQILAGLFSSLVRAELAAEKDPLALVSDDLRENVRKLTLVGAAELCKTAGLRESADAVTRIAALLMRNVTNTDLKARLISLRELLFNELSKRMLFIIPEGRDFYNEHLFGGNVSHAFPSAKMDIGEAAKCWALGRNNAVVYHLMSAAEFGLRALARDRRVEIKNQSGNQTLLEFAQWGAILGELQKKIDSIKNWPATPARNEAQQFYSDAIASARGFNDGWRTHISHARSKESQDDETAALIGHVKRFMMKLSEKISETKFTDEIWP